MNPMRDIIESISEDAEITMGKEFFEEHQEDCDFLQTILPENLIAGFEIATLMAMEGGFALDSIILSLTLEAMLVYRDYLIQKGIDVRALEGR